MKVAIVGAGLSGLSCARELIRHGINPVIFEKQSYMGQTTDISCCILKIFSRHCRDPLKYLRKNYGVSLTPMHILDKIVIYGPTRQAVVRGNLGYIFKRGQESYSMQNQIAKDADLNILYDSYVNVSDIRNEFDYIVAATGESSIPEELNLWKTTRYTRVRVASVIGDFDVHVLKLWVNTEYAKNACAYMVCFNRKMAYLVLVINDISQSEMDTCWDIFLDKEDIRLDRIIELADYRYREGFACPVRAGNVFLAGNAAGVTDDLLGFGSIKAIESGTIAARSLAENLDYNRQLAPLLKDAENLHRYLETVRTFDNNDYDRLITLLGLPVVKRFIYRNPFSRL